MKRRHSGFRRAAGALAVLAALAFAAGSGCGGREAPPRASEEPRAAAPKAPRGAAAATTRTCLRVIDGDTVMLDGRERVRLIGVDTPELHREGTPVQYFARQASAFTRGLAEGRRVRLEYDQARRDKYGRTLGYLYLEDGTFVNLEIVRRGYGFAYTRHPFRFLEEFRAAERAARREGAGLWASPDSIGAPVGPPA